MSLHNFLPQSVLIIQFRIIQGIACSLLCASFPHARVVENGDASRRLCADISLRCSGDTIPRKVTPVQPHVG